MVAGAPALDFNDLTAWSGHFYPIFGTAGNPNFVPNTLWTIIYAEILKQCDGIDGAMDGIIEDPELCYWRPEALLCAPGQTTGCLTGAQAAAVRLVYEPLYGLDGKLLYPRMQPGSELIASRLYYGGTPFAYSVVSRLKFCLSHQGHLLT